MNPRVAVAAALAVICIAWGSTYPVMRVVVETIPPWTGATARFLLAGAVLLLIVGARRGRAGLRLARHELASCALVGVLLMTLTQGLMAVAVAHVPAGPAALVAASAPLWIVILRRAGGERIARAALGGVLLGFAGVALLVAGGSAGAATAAGWLLVVALAALCWALGSYGQRRLPGPRDPLLAAAVQLLTGGAGAAFLALATGDLGRLDTGAVSVASAAGFAYLVLVGSVLALAAYTWLLRRVAISTVATHAYVNPLVAMGLGWILLGEPITPTAAAAGAVIVAAVAVVIRQDDRQTVPPRPAPPAAGQRLGTATA